MRWTPRWPQLSALAWLTCFRKTRSRIPHRFLLIPFTYTCRSGIGGGGFMTIRIPPKHNHTGSEVWTIDFRESAPALANSTMYKHDPLSSLSGGLSIGIPGELRGLEEAHRRWGSLPWARLVNPAAELAKGWEVDRELARRIQVTTLSIYCIYHAY